MHEWSNDPTQSSDLAQYIRKHHSDLYSANETQALKTAILLFKQPSRINLMGNFEVTRNSASLIVDAVLEKAGRRILSESRDAMRLPFCPKRSGILCSPKARQCLACGHD